MGASGEAQPKEGFRCGASGAAPGQVARRGAAGGGSRGRASGPARQASAVARAAEPSQMQKERMGGDATGER